MALTDLKTDRNEHGNPSKSKMAANICQRSNGNSVVGTGGWGVLIHFH